jgi:hypothetical protein
MAATAAAPPQARHRLLATLATVVTRYPEAGNAHVAAQLVAGAADASTAERSAIGAGLTAVGAPAISSLAALAEQTDAADVLRQWAIDVLGAIAAAGHADAVAALVRMLGTGSPELRRHVTRTIGQTPGIAIDDLLAAARRAADATPWNEAREADCWRAVGLHAALADVSVGDRQRATRALVDRLASVHSYELRYRLTAAAARLVDDATVAALESAFATAASDPRAVALRRVAARGLASNDSAAVEPLLVRAATDSDPGTRILAAEALAERGATTRGDPELTQMLASDAWPRARRAAALALGTRCARRDIAAAMMTQVQTESDAQVAAAIVTGLVRCRADGVGNLLFAIIADRARAPEVRLQAATLVGDLSNGSVLPGALKAFAATRREGWEVESSQHIAAAMATALGALQDHRADAVLLEAAQDDAFPTIQAAALQALAGTCPKRARAVATTKARAENRQVRDAARHTLHACWQMRVR